MLMKKAFIELKLLSFQCGWPCKIGIKPLQNGTYNTNYVISIFLRVLYIKIVPGVITMLKRIMLRLKNLHIFLTPILTCENLKRFEIKQFSVIESRRGSPSTEPNFCKTPSYRTLTSLTSFSPKSLSRSPSFQWNILTSTWGINDEK